MSNPIRTISQLQDALDAERVWRLRELSVLRKKLVPSTRIVGPENEDELALLRPCIAMVYAHWEGFVKSACGMYLEFVAMQRVIHKDLASSFLALAARRYATSIGATGASADRAIVTFYRDQADRRGHVPYRGGVDTKSNLWFEVFQEIFDSLGLSWRQYELKSKLIDSKLVSKRNAIAHGRYIDIKAVDVVEIFDSVLDLMESIKDQLLDAAINEEYKLRGPVGRLAFGIAPAVVPGAGAPI